MKKFLSLVLALVMTMSLVTISAGATDFTDAEEVTYTEAVDVLSAVKVIDGYTDGAFKPNNQLNRGQAAKILCNMILGPTTASALKADAAPFKDVPADSTFAAYITYCAKAGIIDGYTDGTFRPTAPLTGYAFMKLLLGALGYDKDVEGYNQPNWSINVAKQALGIGLDDGLTGEFDGTKIVTREEACLYAFNTLKATMVEYDSKTNINVGGAEVIIAGSKAKDVEDKNDANYTIKHDEKLQFAEKYFPKLTMTGTYTDDFGRPSTEWKYKSTVIGNYVNKNALKDTYHKKVTKATLFDLVGKSVVDGLKKDESYLRVYVDGIQVADEDSYASYFAKNDSGAAGISDNGVVTEVYVETIADFDYVTIVQYNTWLYQAAENYSTKNESVKIKTTDSNSVALKSYELKGEDFDVENVKKDDYLLITAVKTSKNSSIYEVKGVDVAETFEGKVTEYASSDSVKFDGEKKSYSAQAGSTTEGTLYTVGESARVVLDKYGYIIGIDTALISSNYVFIAEIGSTSGLHSKAVADAIFTDGTHEEITIAKLYDGSAYVTDAAAIIAGQRAAGVVGTGTFADKWYTYSKTSDGKYVLHTVESKYIDKNAAPAEDSLSATHLFDYENSTSTSVTVLKSGKIDFMNGTPEAGTINSGASDTVEIANDSTILVLKDSDGDYTTYTGVENFPDLAFKFKNSGGSDLKDNLYVFCLVNNNTGYADYVYVDAHDADDSTISDSENVALVYLIKKDSAGRTTDNKSFVDYKTWDPATGESGIVRADAVLSNVTVDGSGNAYGLYYKTRANSDSFLTNIQPVDNTAKYFNKTNSGVGVADKVTFSNGILKFNSTDKFRLTADSQVVLVTRKGTNVNLDPSASYVATVTDGAGVEATLTAVTLTNYNVAGKRISDYSDVVETLYITVNAATLDNSNAVTATVSGNAVFSSSVAGTYASSVTVNAGDRVYVKATGGMSINVAATAAAGVELTASGTAGVYYFICDATGTYTIAVTGDRYSNVVDRSAAAASLAKVDFSGAGYNMTGYAIDQFNKIVGDNLPTQVIDYLTYMGYTVTGPLTRNGAGNGYTIAATDPDGIATTVTLADSAIDDIDKVTIDGKVAYLVDGTGTLKDAIAEVKGSYSAATHGTYAQYDTTSYADVTNAGQVVSQKSYTTGYYKVTLPTTGAAEGVTYTITNSAAVSHLKKDETFDLTVTLSGTSTGTTAKTFTVTNGKMTNVDPLAAASGAAAGVVAKVTGTNTLTITPAGSGSPTAVYTVTVTVTGAGDVSFS